MLKKDFTESQNNISKISQMLPNGQYLPQEESLM